MIQRLGFDAIKRGEIVTQLLSTTIPSLVALRQGRPFGRVSGGVMRG
jgi:hypothetical protein